VAETYKLGFVGAGNMAEAIARAILSAGLYRANELLASDPAEARRRLFQEQLNIKAVGDNGPVAQSCGAILLAVKPQNVAQALAELSGHLQANAVVISIAAGISTEYIAGTLGSQPCRIVRVMPNTPMLAGAGMSVLAAGKNAKQEDLALARGIFDAGGQTLVLDESLMDAVTAVSGSGPAYFFYVAEALVAGGVEAGLGEADALTLARQTMLGAAQLLQKSGEPPVELRRKVTSRGGTTEAAIRVMEQAGLAEAVRRAVLAATERSRQLGR
jgi:pyrroline-5-carboxylate reductase